MMNDVEAIKIIIMEVFYRYKSPIDYDENDFKLIDEMDNESSVDSLFKFINSNELKKIKNIMIEDAFLNYLKSNNYLQIQIDFVEKLKNNI